MAVFSVLSGTLLNVATVGVGTLLGIVLGNRLPARVQESLFGVLGLFTILIGLQGAFATKNALIVLGALLLGTLVGEAVDLDGRLNRFGDRIQQVISRGGKPSRISEAFVTSSLVFCVGPLSILGALDNGLTGDITKLAIKSTLDGFAALAFAAALGPGVLLSAVVILVYQGALSLGAHAIAPILASNKDIITELTATGGLILVAIGLRLLKIRELRVASMLPALVIAPLLVVIVAALGHIQLLPR